MTPEECREELAKTGFGRLACARAGQPYMVPIFFAVEASYIYSFSIAGQKIEWMRGNPCVCLEIDSVKSWKDWTSVIAFGRYEELPDTPEWQAERRRAHGLLQQRAMWWQPASVATLDHAGEVFLPVFFRITLERLTGYRGLSGSEGARAVANYERTKGGWLRQLFRPAEAKP
jgi:nitroimidazol reductase NimA-like FMN-containing flavoprotein (pyridoxamine 5'-phosphate oxidase superfamily)